MKIQNTRIKSGLNPQPLPPGSPAHIRFAPPPLPAGPVPGH